MLPPPKAAGFKALAALLIYPERELIAELDHMRATLEREAMLNAASRALVEALIDHLKSADLLTLQEHYVGLFDRGRSTSLHLFEHVHGESRDRGQAMVDLSQMYRAHGLEIAANELPDYLPLFLEFLSELPIAQAIELLREVAPILATIGAALAKRASPYAGVIAALVALSGDSEAGAVIERAAQAGEAEGDTSPDLDQEWAEEPVTFGGGVSAPASGGCDKWANVDFGIPRGTRA